MARLLQLSLGLLIAVYIRIFLSLYTALGVAFFFIFSLISISANTLKHIEETRRKERIEVGGGGGA
jgi:hypothetical protein